MGWFEDDSDDERSRKRARMPMDFFAPGADTSQVTPAELSRSETETIEEEDPLDAYMKSLSSSKPKDGLKKLQGRMDVANEEEATAHWTVPVKSSASSSNHHQKDSLGSTVSTVSTVSTPLKSDSNPLSNFFHKAGEAVKPPPSTLNMMSDFQYGDDIDPDDVQTIVDKRKKEVDPLEKVDHSKKVYMQFRKCLLPYEHQRIHEGVSRDDPIPIKTLFTDREMECLLPAEVLAHLTKNSYEMSTPVQAQSVPVALSGKDMLVTSPTGSGKTLAFALPMLSHVLDQPRIERNDGPISIILTPTRELAKQVNTVCKKLLQTVGGTSMCIAGGMQGTYEISKELKKGCDVVVSTPGRFIDMVKRKATNCDRVTLVILDEFDKLLAMGFEQQVGSILSHIRPDRQSWMFSATVGKKIQRVADRWLNNDYVRVDVGSGLSSEHVAQHVFVMPDHAKRQWIIEMLPILNEIGRSIIFVSSRTGCEELATYINAALGDKGIIVASIHGDKHQSDRNASLSSLKKGRISALVATDVAARGLDVTDIMTVVNYDAATSIDSHVHRIGRAGRLSSKKSSAKDHKHNKGNAYTLLTPKNADFAADLASSFRKENREVPDELADLASKSRKYYGKSGRDMFSKTGLGFNKQS